MKIFIVLCSVISLVYCKSLASHANGFGSSRCINMWDEGCINDQLWGAGNDDNFLGGGFTPGKRCINMWDDGCANGPILGAGNDDNYLGGSFTPGKRCVNMWDEGCDNTQLGGYGIDNDYINGGLTQGKNPLYKLFQQFKKTQHRN